MALDLDGDGVDELVVYRRDSQTWFWYTLSSATGDSAQWGLPGDVAVGARPRQTRGVTADVDGDGRSDFVVYRPDDGTWYMQSSFGSATATVVCGGTPFVAAIGDYNGNGSADPGVFDPTDGTWRTSTWATPCPASPRQSWGLAGDVAVAGDYDGDGATDRAVFRPSTGEWYVLFSSGEFGESIVRQWGLSGDQPVAADFDGDGRAEFAVFRPSTGEWYILNPFTGAGQSPRQWGLSGDWPIAQDFDGDGHADLGVFRPSTGEWWVRVSSTSAVLYRQWGLSGDTPLGRSGSR
jgi:hypothetical protein